MPTTVSTIYVPFVKFPICITSDNTGSSQNVTILAKGEPLTVLAAPVFIIMDQGIFSYEFLRNKYTKLSILKLAIFTELDFVHFAKRRITDIFGLFAAKRFHRSSSAEPFYVSFYTNDIKNGIVKTVDAKKRPW